MLLEAELLHIIPNMAIPSDWPDSVTFAKAFVRGIMSMDSALDPHTSDTVDSIHTCSELRHTEVEPRRMRTETGACCSPGEGCRSSRGAAVVAFDRRGLAGVAAVDSNCSLAAGAAHVHTDSASGRSRQTCPYFSAATAAADCLRLGSGCVSAPRSLILFGASKCSAPTSCQLPVKPLAGR